MEKKWEKWKKNYDLEEWNGTVEEPNRQAEELWGMLIRGTNESRKGRSNARESSKIVETHISNPEDQHISSLDLKEKNPHPVEIQNIENTEKSLTAARKRQFTPKME